MPKENVKKTKSVHKFNFREKLSILSAFFIISFALVFAVYFVINQTSNLNESEILSCDGVQLNLGCFELEKATTDEQRAKGLSDRDGLADRKGMVFIFDNVEEQCFWMKDVRFSIDMIWLNEAKQIIKIENNVSPDTYPSAFCQQDTKYVLEFNAGTADENGLKVGSTVQF